jgi:ferredoxin-NADP reductase
MPAPVYRATVEGIESLAYNVRAFRFRLVEPSRVAFAPGQFMIVHVPQDGRIVKRAYSIASPPHEDTTVELCIQHVEGGSASSYFWRLAEGETVSLSGPHGAFVLKEPLDYDPVFLATGTGVAPLRAMIKYLFHVNCARQIWLFFGTRYEHALLYDSEFRSLAALRPNFHYLPTVSRPKEWRGEVGHIQQTFQQHITDYAGKELYICGWQEIVKAICADLEGLGVRRAQLHYEEWA